MEHLNLGHTPLHPMQFDFRTHHSTETAICVFLEKVKSLLDRNTLVGAIFHDLNKAFDSVNHQVLLSRLTHFNFSEHTLHWFASYLSGRKQHVAVDGVNSASLEFSQQILALILYCYLWLLSVPPVREYSLFLWYWLLDDHISNSTLLNVSLGESL